MNHVIPHRELRNNSSAILREVMAGESFTVTNHGEKVAVLSPIGSAVPAETRMRRATRTRFADIESITLDHPIQETLDELRGDR